MSSSADFFRSHRAHDVVHLVSRWRRLARALRLPLQTLCVVNEFPVVLLEHGDENNGLYVSAGIHGDEVGATEGLLRWAERGGLAALRSAGIPFVLAPCLNPWGLANNSRVDARGRDLNRSFQSPRLSPIRELRAALEKRRFRLALTLHEDFDAQGLYLYEIRGAKPYWGEQLAGAVAKWMPADARRQIEGRPARGGVIRPRLDQRTREFLRTGCPEALWLHFSGQAARVFTFETASEHGLDLRAETHAQLVSESVRLAFGI